MRILVTGGTGFSRRSHRARTGGRGSRTAPADPAHERHVVRQRRPIRGARLAICDNPTAWPQLATASRRSSTPPRCYAPCARATSCGRIAKAPATWPRPRPPPAWSGSSTSHRLPHRVPAPSSVPEPPETTLHPVSAYGRSKAASEDEVPEPARQAADRDSAPADDLRAPPTPVCKRFSGWRDAASRPAWATARIWSTRSMRPIWRRRSWRSWRAEPQEVARYHVSGDDGPFSWNDLLATLERVAGHRLWIPSLPPCVFHGFAPLLRGLGGADPQRADAGSHARGRNASTGLDLRPVFVDPRHRLAGADAAGGRDAADHGVVPRARLGLIPAFRCPDCGRSISMAYWPNRPSVGIRRSIGDVSLQPDDRSQPPTAHQPGSLDRLFDGGP